MTPIKAKDAQFLCQIADVIANSCKVELAWRVPIESARTSERAFLVRCRSVRGRAALMAAVSEIAEGAWGGELRLRYESSVLWTGVIEVEFWKECAPLPILRPGSLWRREERTRAATEGFLSRVRPVFADAARNRLMHPRDALLLVQMAEAACAGPISRPWSG